MQKQILLLFISVSLAFCAKAQTQLITNGALAGSSGWTTSGNWFISTAFSCYHSATGYAYAGSAGGSAVINEAGDLKQTITIPAAAGSANFSFYFSASTDETTVTTVFDYVNVYLLDGSGNQLMQFTPTNVDNLNAGSPVGSCSAYGLRSFSVPPAYFGQPVQIDFRVHTDGSLNTMFRIDDVSLTWSATACNYSLNTSSAAPASSAGIGSVFVTAAAGCGWTAVSNNTSWLTVSSGATGNGNGTVNYSYTLNTSASPRTGTITIAGNTFTVTQAGAGSGSLYGVDIYSGNGSVSWSTVNTAGKAFAFVKATKGLCYTDGLFNTNMTSANPGVVLGAYHFALPEDNPNAVDEANYFYTAAHNYIGTGRLPPALDMEDPAGSCITNATPLSTYYNTPALQLQLAQWVNNWCNRIHTLTGVWPVLYVDRCRAALLAPNYTNGTINANIKLWMADYSHTAGYPANAAGCTWDGWPWIFHQYFAPGGAGNNPTTYADPGMDQDIFNGDLAAFNNLIAAVPACTNNTNNTWTGAVSAAWENPGNWACGIVPDATTNVTINSGSVIVNSNAICRSLTIMPGVIFTTNAGYNFTIAH